MERILNDQAHVAGNWYSNYKLLANKEKFHAIVITKKIGQDLPKIHLEVDNEEIEQMTCLKLLGVTTDHQLSFSEHVKDVKSSQKIGVPPKNEKFNSMQRRLSYTYLKLIFYRI